MVEKSQSFAPEVTVSDSEAEIRSRAERKCKSLNPSLLKSRSPTVHMRIARRNSVHQESQSFAPEVTVSDMSAPPPSCWLTVRRSSLNPSLLKSRSPTGLDIRDEQYLTYASQSFAPEVTVSDSHVSGNGRRVAQGLNPSLLKSRSPTIISSGKRATLAPNKVSILRS